MRTQADIAAAEKRRGSLIGSLFIVPSLAALVLLSVWVLMAILLTPGVALDGAYGEAQRFTRGLLVWAGTVIDLGGFGFLLWRLTLPSDAG
jgi:hypothetical protein